MTAAASARERLVIGVMTGTSIDGIDAALVRITSEGPAMRASIVDHASRPLGELVGPLREAASRTTPPGDELGPLATALGRLHGDVVALLGPREGTVDLVAVHGQTVYHRPPRSVQLIDPVPVARAACCPVIYDMRQADLAAGGQGAPITPIADLVMFAGRDGPRVRRVILNLGGFASYTALPAATGPDVLSQVAGGDVCVCNQLLDLVARRALGRPYDDKGGAAGGGRIDPDARAVLGDLLERQRSAGRSLGTGDEAATWVDEHLPRLSPADLAATAVDAVARCVALTVAAHAPDEIVVAGGGARNATLVDRLAKHAGRPVRPSDHLGIPIEIREAAAMAVLGALSADGVPITLPQITGCRAPAPVAGRWCRREPCHSPEV